MKNPLLNVNLEAIQFPTSITIDWFDDDSIELKKIHAERIESVDNKVLKTELKRWNQSLNREHIDTDQQEDILYEIAPVDSDISLQYTKSRNLPAEQELDDESVSIHKSFSYVLTLPDNSTPIGLVTGSYSTYGYVDIKPKAEDSKEIELRCSIGSIILAPELRGQGIGKSVAEIISNLGLRFSESILEQFPTRSLSKITIAPVVEAELYSRSGSRWFDHLYSNVNTEVFMLLASYVNEENIKETTYDASL